MAGRLSRFVLAGVLLYAAALLLTGLLAQPGYRWTSLTAAAVFLPLWYAIAVVNAWLGVASAGYPLRDEVLVFLPVFGMPVILAGLIAWADRATGGGGMAWASPRFLLLMAVAVALFAAVMLIAGPLAQSPSLAAGLGPAVLVFGPLWLTVCITNMVIGVQFAGYGMAEELSVLLLNAAVPITATVGLWRLTARRGLTAHP